MAEPAYCDSHCHLQDSAFDDDREAVLVRARSAGVDLIVTIASSPADAARARAVAAAAPPGVEVRHTAGLHPHEAGAWGPQVRAALERELAAGAVAVGETGLDRHYDHAHPAAQREAFAAQLALAGERDLPVVVHSRESEDDTLALLADSTLRPERIVLHCFSGSRAMLEAAVERGYYVSFSGMATFARFPADVLVPLVPPERILAETDAPYLAPVPHRGHRNEPAYVVETVAALARLQGIAPAEMARRTRDNARRFYQLSG